jgi:hypothetical protein
MTITDQRMDNPSQDLLWRGTMARTRGNHIKKAGGGPDA